MGRHRASSGHILQILLVDDVLPDAVKCHISHTRHAAVISACNYVWLLGAAILLDQHASVISLLSLAGFTFLQYFDTVGWVFWPVKIVSYMTYIVLAGT